jgi:hypothetical protein
VDGLPGREVMRKQAPSAATLEQVQDGVDDLAGVVYLWTTGSLGCGQVGLKAGRFDIGEVGRVWCSHGW